MEENQRDPGAEHSQLSVSVDAMVQQGEDRQKPSAVARFLWALCQCVMDNDYHETVAIEDGSEEGDFLPKQVADVKGRNTLILDLDETLVHSSLEPQLFTSFTIPLDDDSGAIYVAMRPNLTQFLKTVAGLFEVIIFTASMPGYANPVIDRIDPDRLISHRLFRSCCRLLPFGFLKDLSRLGRDLRRVVIIDVRTRQNCPQSYALHPGNAIPISTWLNDPRDHELLELMPLLEKLAQVDDVVEVLTSLNLHSKENGNWVNSTNRARSSVNSPLHRMLREEKEDESNTTADTTILKAKRCQTDGNVQYQ